MASSEQTAEDTWFMCRRCRHQVQLKEETNSENVLTRAQLEHGVHAFICPQCQEISTSATKDKNPHQFGRLWCNPCGMFVQGTRWATHDCRGTPGSKRKRATYLDVFRHRDAEGRDIRSALDHAPIPADNNHGDEQNTTAPNDAINENHLDDAQIPSDNTGGDSNNFATAFTDMMNTSAFDDGLSDVLGPAFKCSPFEVYCGDPSVELTLLLTEPRAVPTGDTTSVVIELSGYRGRSVGVVCASLDRVVQLGKVVRNDPVFYEFNARSLFMGLDVPDTYFEADVTLHLLGENSEVFTEKRSLRFRKTPKLEDRNKLVRHSIELQKESELPSNESTTSDSPNATQQHSSSTGLSRSGVRGHARNGTYTRSAVLWRSELHLIFAVRPLLANTIAAGRHDLIEQLKGVATKCDYRLLLHEIVETQLARVVATVFTVQWNSATIERSAQQTCLVDNVLGFIRSVEVCAADAQPPKRQCCAPDNLTSVNYGARHVLEYLGCDFASFVEIKDWASRSITGWMRSKLRRTDVSEPYEGVPDQTNDVLDISSRNAAAALASKILQTSDHDDDIDSTSTQSIGDGWWKNRPSYDQQQQDFVRHKQDVLAGTQTNIVDDSSTMDVPRRYFPELMQYLPAVTTFWREAAAGAPQAGRRAANYLDVCGYLEEKAPGHFKCQCRKCDSILMFPEPLLYGDRLLCCKICLLYEAGHLRHYGHSLALLHAEVCNGDKYMWYCPEGDELLSNNQIKTRLRNGQKLGGAGLKELNKGSRRVEASFVDLSYKARSRITNLGKPDFRPRKAHAQSDNVWTPVVAPYPRSSMPPVKSPLDLSDKEFAEELAEGHGIGISDLHSFDIDLQCIADTDKKLFEDYL